MSLLSVENLIVRHGLLKAVRGGAVQRRGGSGPLLLHTCRPVVEPCA